MFSGWWLTYPSEKYDFFSWGYEIPNMIAKKITLKKSLNVHLDG